MRARGCIFTTLIAASAQAVSAPVAAQTPDTPPVPITSHELTVADFPRESALGRDEGIVRLRFRVTEEGTVSECSVENGSGYPRLDEAACTVASRWKYKPATEGGKATSAMERTDLLFWIPGTAFPRDLNPDRNSAGDPSLDVPDSFKPANQPQPAFSPRQGFSPAEPINSHALVADDYPAVSIQLQEQGSIPVLYRIADMGDVSECAVLSSSGFPRLDEAACAVVGRWKFKPATQDGKAMSSFVRANVIFQFR